jgi:periplasmic protein TonB
MAKQEINNDMPVVYSNMDDLVFAKRNKLYGAYFLRKKYAKYVVISFLISLFILGGAIAKPLYEAYQLRGKERRLNEKKVEAVMENLDQQDAPPPPPPPPPAAIQQQVKFVAPVIVDEVKEDVNLVTADDLLESSVNEAPPEEITVTQEVETVIEKEEEGVWFVEENATFQGGDLNSFSTWVKERILYPAMASEAGITGKVFVQFSVNREGHVVDVKVVRSVHPSLDNEAVRVIQSSPRWTPAKQSGTAVKQNFVIPIAFQLQ